MVLPVLWSLNSSSGAQHTAVGRLINLRKRILFYKVPSVWSSLSCESIRVYNVFIFSPTQFLVTLSLSYMVGAIASFHDTVAVVITMGATLGITVSIIAFSVQVRKPCSFLFFLLFLIWCFFFIPAKYQTKDEYQLDNWLNILDILYLILFLCLFCAVRL